jgi:adenosylcobinamide kinase/adenosylcobinamide-phosphate guanylyltransferase
MVCVEKKAVIELIVGGARSGKSALAEQHAEASGMPVIYIATGQAGDAEMTQRIAHHQQRRPAHWTLVEEPLFLADSLRKHATENTCVIVDCLTLWLTNLLCHVDENVSATSTTSGNRILFERETAELIAALADVPGHIILVSNEVGWGIVPMGELSRVFTDEQGRLNQRIAQLAQRVTLVVAGLPLALK